MSFTAADILAEFVEAAGHLAPSQREFDYAAFVNGRRRWDTPEERQRSRDRYAARCERPMTKRAAMAYARSCRKAAQKQRLRAALDRQARLRRQRRDQG